MHDYLTITADELPSGASAGLCLLRVYNQYTDGRMDCCNLTLPSVARLINQLPKFSHVSSYIQKILRWFPVDQPTRLPPGVAVSVRLAITYLINNKP